MATETSNVLDFRDPGAMRGTDSRASRMNEMVLRFFSESRSGHAMRLKAGQKHPTVIPLPHLTLFATGIPKFVYGALSAKALENGLLGRCLFIETDEFRPLGEMSAAKLPQSVVETAKAMAAREKRFNETYVLEPVVVTETPEAKHMLRELRFVTWSCKLADGTEKSGACDKVFNNTPCTLDFHWPEDVPAEAIGRDIVLTFRLHVAEPAVNAVLRVKLVVRAALDDFAVVHHEDEVRVADRRG